MQKTRVYLGEALARYGFGEGHPFGPDRLTAFQREFEQQGLDKRCVVQPPADGDPALLTLFHTEGYRRRLHQLSASGEGWLDGGGTPAFAGILDASLTIIGTVCAAADALMQGECQHAFVPIAGLHHARRDRAAGFCAVNDCGIVIEHLRATHGIQRIAYIDIDAHHGDGVFYTHEDDPDVIIVDFHEDGRFLYPGTGRTDETGKGRAAGTKLNVPLPPEAGDALFEKLWDKAETFLAAHPADRYLLQVGADSIAGDPITHLALTPASHTLATRRVSELFAGKPILALGGGGYNRKNLAKTWTAVVASLLGDG